MQIVYALTTDGRDVYTAMTRVSALSLRLFNRHARIIVACDAPSAKHLRQARSPLLNEIDELLTCAVPEGNAVFRNRFVKTSLRQRITGAFLFLDSDTLVRGDLSELFQVKHDLAGARNHSRAVRSEQVFIEDTQTLAAMSWTAAPGQYVNGGVLLYNDSAGAYRFGQQWHANWLRSSAQLGRYRDQPALNAALVQSGASLRLLSDTFNAQVKATPSVASNALIVHYYSSVDAPQVYAFDVLVGQLLAGKQLTRREVWHLARRNHLWRRDWWIDDLFVNSLQHKTALDELDQLWLTGHRRAAFRRRWEQQCQLAPPRTVALKFLRAAMGIESLSLPNNRAA